MAIHDEILIRTPAISQTHPEEDFTMKKLFLLLMIVVLAASVSLAAAETYVNPFPDVINRFTVPFPGTLVDHQLAVGQFVSLSSPSDDHYAEYAESGKISEQIGWDKYSGPTHDMYIIYRNNGRDVYAYAFAYDYASSRRTEWASGSLFPNMVMGIGAVYWIVSGENNATYADLMTQATSESDIDGVKKIIRNPDPYTDVLWCGYQLSIMRQELGGGMDRYWLFFHNTGR